MKVPLLKKIDTQEFDCQPISPLRDPSLSRCIGTGCASAQDDSQLSDDGREKKAAKPPSFSPLFSAQRIVILSAAKDLSRNFHILVLQLISLQRKYVPLRILTLLLFLLTATLSFSQKAKDVRNLNIKSKTVTTKTHKKGEVLTFKDTYEEFDKNGKPTLEIEYTKSGEIKNKKTYKYDNYNNVTEESQFDKKTGKTTTTTYQYNPDGNKSLEVVKDELGNIIEKSVFKYNSKQLRIEKTEYDGNNNLKSTKITTYEYYR
jgi:hypothetical protein